MCPFLARPFSVVLLLIALFCGPAALPAQTPVSGSATRNIQTVPDRADVVAQQLVAKAEDHYKQGLLNLRDKKQEQAREEFDKAVDTIYESGLDVRANATLHRYFIELVERIYRLEAPNTTPMPMSPQLVAANYGLDGTEKLEMLDQEYEPGNLEQVSKLELTPEEVTVTKEKPVQLRPATVVLNSALAVNTLVPQFIKYYQGRGRDALALSLESSGPYINLVRRIFHEEGVPEDLAWLGQLESGWRPRATQANKAGFWSFTPSLGIRYGLRQTAWVDERYSYEKATRAAALYLRDLAAHYKGDWRLATIAYKIGVAALDRALSRAKTSEFAGLYPYLPPATRDYWPHTQAVTLIAKAPELYGFGNVPRWPALQYATVEVNGSVGFSLVALATGVDVDAIRYLNPELLRDCTPSGESYRLSVPFGRGNKFLAVMRRIPVNLRSNIAALVTAAPSETLAQFAHRNSLSLEALRQVNQGVSIEEEVGFVIVPHPGLKKVATTAEVADLLVIDVHQPTSLVSLAGKLGVDAKALAVLNGLPVNAMLRQGQSLKIPRVTKHR